MIRKLTTQEIKILSLIAVGLTNAEIADRLNISDKTVKAHRQNILSKFDGRNITHVVYLAIHLKLLK